MESFIILASLIISVVIGATTSTTTANMMPEFIPNEETIVIQLKEGSHTPVGSVIHEFSGKDWEGDTLTFYLTEEASDSGVAPTGVFNVESTSKTEANLVLSKLLDREETPEYILEVFLTDGRTMRPSSQKILVIVMDINDNYPVFGEHNSTFNVQENISVPHLIATFQATDVDEGPNGEVSYLLKYDGQDKEVTPRFDFTVTDDDDSYKVELWLMVSLDFEKSETYVLYVIAHDNPIGSSEEARKESIINVTINVLDVNNRLPVFSEMKIPAAEIPENIPVGSSVVSVYAVDGDQGINCAISYTLVNELDKFSVDPTTGVIETRFPFDTDRLTVGTYRLLVRASELNNSPSVSMTHSIPNTVTSVKYAEMEVVVKVTEIWGNPHFQNVSLVGEVPENSTPGFPVRTKADYIAEVYDYDKRGRDLIKLTVEGDAGTFDVIPKEGYGRMAFQLVVKNPDRLDYEKIQEIHFDLVATDSGGNKTRLPVSVIITDKNDNSPIFSKSRYFVKIPENPAPGTLVGTFEANDADSGLYGQQGVRYVKLYGLAAQHLELNEITGKITVKKEHPSPGNESEYLEAKSVFDREKYSEIFMTIEARDNLGNQGNVGMTLLILQLLDENDNSPQFSHFSYEREIYENERIISLRPRIDAIDADQPETNNSRIRYSLKLAAENQDDLRGYLDIDSVSGVLTISRAFDFEQVYKSYSSHAMTHSDTELTLKVPIKYIIQASDLGNSPQMTEVGLTVFLWDRNDCAPEFNPLEYNIIVREDLQGPQEIGRVTAQDGDASIGYNSVVYQISPGNSSVAAAAAQELEMFTIDLKSGVISLQSGYSFDYNLRREYLLHVGCSDRFNLKAEREALVKVTVLDVNNKPPKFLQRSDNSNVECSWHDTIDDCSMTVCYTANVSENTRSGVKIIQVEASDLDSSAVLRYRIADSYGVASNGQVVDDLEDYIAIDPVSGVVSTGSVALDYETVNTLRVPLIVEDIAGEINTPQVGRAWLVVNILNVNDLPPTFLQSEYLTVVEENSPFGTEVTVVTAVGDEEAVDIFYSIVEQEWNPKSPKHTLPFQIDSKKGIVYVKGSLDREKMEGYNFSVQARTKVDGTKSFVQSSVQVYVQLKDMNDNSPIFHAPIESISVKENTPLGHVIAKAHAVDPDQGSFGKVTYVLVGNSSQGKFFIDSSSGDIRVSGKLDREQKDSYQLKIKAVDNFDGICFRHIMMTNSSNSVIKTVHVRIQDVNDNSPTFHFLPGSNPMDIKDVNQDKTYSTWDNISDKHPILLFGLTDGDEKGTPNSAVGVKIIPNESDDNPTLFKLLEVHRPSSPDGHHKTWILVKARSLLGFDGNHSVVLKAKDKGTPTRSSVYKINIQIKPTNFVFNSIRFSKKRYTAALTTGYPQGTRLLQVTLTRINKIGLQKIPANLTFKLTPVTEALSSQNTQHQPLKLFSIHPTSGQISTSFDVNNRNYPNATYSLNVSVQWSPTGGMIRRKFVPLTVYWVATSQKLNLLSRLPWKGAKYGHRKSTQLGNQLEQLFGLLVNVEPVPKILSFSNVNKTPNLLFKVSIICPRTKEVLERHELLKVFQHFVLELRKVFQSFQIIHLPFESVHGGVDNPASIIWNLLEYIWDEKRQNDVDIYREGFIFAEEFYLCYGTATFIIIMFLISILLIMKAINNLIGFLTGDILGEDPIIQLDSTKLLLTGNMKLPAKAKRQFHFRLDQDVSSGAEKIDEWPLIPNESDC